MRFQKGEHYPHPPRGRARHPYHVSDLARCARRLNLSNTRIRSTRETLTIKLWIWQATFGNGPHLSQRELARQLGVCRSYIHKVQHQRAQATHALAREAGVTMDDLLAAQDFTAGIREQEPTLLRPVHATRCEKARPLTEDEIIAQTWREVVEWKRKNLQSGGRGWFRW
jgi:hypothetical protein